jgi:hypothetical protein
MKSLTMPFFAIVLASLSVARVGASQERPATGAGHRGLAPDQVVWTEQRPGFWSAAIDGDPMAPGKPYSLMLKLADGQWIPPHWHPNDNRVFVVSGTLLMGMGDSLDVKAAAAQGPGTFNLVPARARHYEGARGETVLLLYGIGPLTTTFVKPGG